MKVGFLSINTQFENLGDALINRELVRLLAEHGKVVVDVGNVPTWFSDILELSEGVERVLGKRKLLSSILKERAAGNTVYYFFRPGAVFGDIPISSLTKNLALLALYYFLKLVGVRFCHVGLSCERLGKNFRIFLRARGLLMHKSFVRDDESSSLLDSLKIKHDGVLPDLAFNIFSSAPVVGEKVGKVCFSFRVDQYLDQLDECCFFIERVIRQFPDGVEVFFSVQVDRDLPGMKLIKKKLEEKTGASMQLIHESRSIDNMLAFYATIDLVVSNRLHVLLLAASVSGRVLAYAGGKNRKIYGLFQTIGRGDLLMGEETSDNEIAQALAAAPFRGELQRDRLRSGIKAIYY